MGKKKVKKNYGIYQIEIGDLITQKYERHWDDAVCSYLMERFGEDKTFSIRELGQMKMEDGSKMRLIEAMVVRFKEKKKNQVCYFMVRTLLRE